MRGFSGRLLARVKEFSSYRRGTKKEKRQRSYANRLSFGWLGRVENAGAIQAENLHNAYKLLPTGK